MFELLSYSVLQEYWWVIISLLGALLIFLMFVQGGQTLLKTIASNEEEKTILINSIGRKWEFTFTTLVMFGGAIFAAFPRFYAVSFGGAYWVWITILFCFTLQAVSYEFRRKPGNVLGPRAYEAFLYINGSLGVFLIGVAISTFYTGSEFLLVDNISTWQSPLRGLEAIFNIQNCLLGFSVFFLSRVLGAMYFINNINIETIAKKSKKAVLYNSVAFLLTFIPFIIILLLSPGYKYDSYGIITTESFAYLNNFIELPILIILFSVGLILVLYGIFSNIFSRSRKCIWFSGAGTVLTVLALLLCSGLNSTSFYPSTSDMQSSLTIANSSSSEYTLTVMSYISLFIPFVLLYIFFAWKIIDKNKIDKKEIKENEHIY